MSSSEEPQHSSDTEPDFAGLHHFAMERARAHGLGAVFGEDLLDMVEAADADGASAEAKASMAARIRSMQRGNNRPDPSQLGGMLSFVQDMLASEGGMSLITAAMERQEALPTWLAADIRHQALELVRPDAEAHGEADPDHELVYLFALLKLAVQRAETARDCAYLEAMLRAGAFPPAIADRYGACVRAFGTPIGLRNFFREAGLCGACAPVVADMHREALQAVKEEYGEVSDAESDAEPDEDGLGPD